jgi:hypothetical protein
MDPAVIHGRNLFAAVVIAGSAGLMIGAWSVQRSFDRQTAAIFSRANLPNGCIQALERADQDLHEEGEATGRKF